MLAVLVAAFAMATVASSAASPSDLAQEGVAAGAADSFVDDLFAGRWIDPSQPYWAPRRGERVEFALLLGGEVAFEALSREQLPSLGGMVLTIGGRYYPVDRLAVIFGARTYVGLDGGPASGTTASSVITLITGVRYDLVREKRFSLMWDLYSGPSLVLFAEVPESLALGSPVAATGGEMGTGLSMRYSIGPLTGEARGVIGGRAGAAAAPFQETEGPFSAAYAGIELGLTWSMQP